MLDGNCCCVSGLLAGAHRREIKETGAPIPEGGRRRLVTRAVTGHGPLPLSFRSCVPFREIRLCDVDGVGDFFGVPGASFGGGSAGCSLAPGAVAGQVEIAVRLASGLSGGVRSAGRVPRRRRGRDEAEDGGERDEAGVEPGGSGGAGGSGGGDVVESGSARLLAGRFRGWPRSGRRGPRTVRLR